MHAGLPGPLGGVPARLPEAGGIPGEPGTGAGAQRARAHAGRLSGLGAAGQPQALRLDKKAEAAMTKEQVYKAQMQALGIYEEIFDPEIRTLARIERELTRAMKAWSETAVPPGSRPVLSENHPALLLPLRWAQIYHTHLLQSKQHPVFFPGSVLKSDPADISGPRSEKIHGAVFRYEGLKDEKISLASPNYSSNSTVT